MQKLLWTIVIAVMAQVLAVHPESGMVLLATDAGMVSIQAEPEEIASLKAGDFVSVDLDDAQRDDTGAPEYRL